jgi:arylsulfatase A-like enzyme
VLIALDLMRHTLVVVGADHGEAFREHATEGHGRNLYAEVTRVPLFFALPFRLPSPVVVEPLVRNVDLWPTVFDLLGLPARSGVEGTSLVPLIEAAAEGRDQESLAPPTALAALDLSWGRLGAEPRPLVSLTRWPHRILLTTTEPRRIELYRIDSDPAEQNDLAETEAMQAEDLRAQVEARLEGSADSDLAIEVEIDAMRLEQLRALGYAGPR